jgi:hypothetical protein
MRVQVARSKGTEWMVSNYNAWQERSPLPEMPKREITPLMRLANQLALKEKQLNSIMTLSFRSILLIIGLIMSVRGR